ncbi:MAG: alpha/beta hydrolase [Nitrososphaerota archaeon]|nr:alpha/beta hydrolase [Nitrososphaerota archaeon]
MGSHVLTLPDGRQLGYFVAGKGVPVIYFHGTASSRIEALLLKRFSTQNLKIIAIDRPGYGLSTYKPRKNIQDFNCDLNFLADHLGITQFSVLGWSGGGTFALAYMACFPQRINHGVVVGTPDLPFDASTAHDMPLAKYMMRLPVLGALAMKNMRRQILKADCSEDFLRSSTGRQMLHGCSSRDLVFFSNPNWIELMYQSMAEAFRQNDGVRAVLEEHRLFLKTWNLPFKAFKGIGNKLWIWHGVEDKTCPVDNAYRIARKFEGTGLEVFPRQGHCVMFDNLDRLAELLI